MRNLYVSEDVKKAVGIRRYLEDNGFTIHGNRFQARWRDGDGFNCAIGEDDRTWYDHVGQEGGSVLDLCARVENIGIMIACSTLGDRYGLTPKVNVKPAKKIGMAEHLVEQGYEKKVTYTYTDESGKALYFVDRYEKWEGDKRVDKSFVQRTEESEGIKGVRRVLYHLPAVIAAPLVFVVEGEKDADTLARLGLTATTNSGGGKFWADDFDPFFDGKEVVILPDNDTVGDEHGDTVLAHIMKRAKSVRRIVVSKLPKGDVTDWIEREGGTKEALLALIANTADVRSDAKAIARELNRFSLRNYVEIQDDKNPNKVKIEPRNVNEICEEIHKRFLDFPYIIGGTLFDHVKDSGEILKLINPDALKAWVDGTSNQPSDFKTGGKYASWKVVMERLLQTGRKFQVIANAPWYPKREDSFPVYGELPKAEEDHATFWKLLDFFNPATPADRTLMAAFFMAPMFNTPASRSAWIIDTVDAQASGKTTVVKMCAKIYDEVPLDIDLNALEMDESKIVRRILSAEGRKKRIAIFDNLTSAFKSKSLAKFVTDPDITGMAPYGRGEETRKNDITWCATMNGASVDTDMATRSYTIKIRSPGEDADPMWESKVRDFIDKNRKQILSDIQDMLENAKPRRRRGSRFGEFDAVVLSAACRTDDEFDAADKAIREASETANNDADLAAQCVEAITTALASYSESETHIRADMACVILRRDMDNILADTRGALKKWTSHTVRKFVNQGLIPNIVKNLDRIQTAKGNEITHRERLFVFAANENLVKGSIINVQYLVFDGKKPVAKAFEAISNNSDNLKK